MNMLYISSPPTPNLKLKLRVKRPEVLIPGHDGLPDRRRLTLHCTGYKVEHFGYFGGLPYPGEGVNCVHIFLIFLAVWSRSRPYKISIVICLTRQLLFKAILEK